MKELEQNMIRIYAEKGKQWFADLPMILNELTRVWNLSHVVPVENMSFNYVTKAIQYPNKPVILKIICDKNAFIDEMHALQYFDGSGSIQIIAVNECHHALLLQRAVPGVTLTSIYSSQIEYVMDSYVNTMQKLHQKHFTSQYNFKHISDWLIAIDHLTDHRCPAPLLEKAINLKNKLLASSTNEVLLHGDLHHDNIIQQGDQWLAIDPKGIVGEPEFEIAAFDFMYVRELANNPAIKKIIENRAVRLAQKSNLNSQRIYDWILVRLVLMAAFQIEDNMDPTWSLKLAEIIARVER